MKDVHNQGVQFLVLVSSLSLLLPLSQLKEVGKGEGLGMGLGEAG